MLIGYARVSTKDQKLDRQIDELIEYGVAPDNIYTEKLSGRKKDRPELNNMLKALREGDTVVVSELTRVSRSTKDLFNLVEKIQSKGARIKSLKESWLDTTTPQGRFIFTIMAGLAEFEAELTRQRVKSGLEAARKRGINGGRPVVNPEKLKLAVDLYDSKDYSIRQIEEMTGISKSSLYNYLRKRDLEECEE